MGGIIRSTFSKTTSKAESATSAGVSLEAEIKVDIPIVKPDPLLKAKGEAKLLDYTAKPKVSGNVTYTSQVVGGDVTKFAGEAKSQKDVQMMQNEWAKTINTDLSGFNHRLLPIQELVRHFNQAFADDMQKAIAKAGGANLKKGGTKYSEDV